MPHPIAALHLPDWQPALAELAAHADAATRDAAIARWAQACWRDLGTALPQQRHALLAHPGNVAEPARVYIVTPQAQGWLYSPLHGAPDAPHWSAASAAVLAQAATEAIERGFCAADCAVLGMMGALAAAEARCSTPPPDFARQRRHFPLLDAVCADPHTSPHAALQSSFAPMPRSVLAAAHPHALYAVMGDADMAIRCMELGMRLVQLRLKNATAETLAASIARCAEAASRHGALLILNDHWRATLRHVQHHDSHGIYGIHLGQEDLHQLSDADLAAIQRSGLRLGLSTHSLWELASALRVRPSYIACGPVHATRTKAMPWLPLGNTNIGWWAHIVHGAAGSSQPPLPLVAIGGMTPERAQAAAAAGADMVAAVSAIADAIHPEAAVQALQTAIAQGHAQRPEKPAPAWPQPTLAS